jgi:DNA-binding PadR family transcriptional regulator
MNLSRLMVLGLLASHGPRHGHQIRRDAEGTNVSTWGGVNVGALYRELRLMEQEGLVEPVRTEQIGRRPARTVYQITSEGQRELAILREQAILNPHPAPDTLSVALLFGRVWDKAELQELLQARRRTIDSVRAGLGAKREQLQVKGYLTALDVSVFRRAELRLEAELRWHDEIDKVLAELPDPARHAGSTRRPKKRG